ncbi:MAG: glycosyltransferase [Promethearchaeota archaeon]|nr:MAG: glycosyltransferase [Candidatus Lokiarchaeota archaeon]
MRNNNFNLERIGKYSKQLLTYEPYKKRKLRNNKGKKPRIVRVLCQRPFFTGSGINLVNLTKRTAKKGLEQFIIFGHPVDEPNPLSEIIEEENTSPVRFSGKKSSTKAEIPFPVAGMSDQMPYGSTRFSTFNETMLETYLKGFGRKIERAIDQFKPNIIHSHHLWLVTSLCRVLNPHIPIIATCHNTGLRQMELASQLRDFMIKPIKDLDSIAVIDTSQQRRVEKIYDFDREKDKLNQFLHIGQGINTDIFCPPPSHIQRDSKTEEFTIIYVGKLSFSKGVPQLIEAFKLMCKKKEYQCKLLLVGAGKGEERERIYEMAKDFENIFFLGQIEQADLSKRLKKSDLFVLPSFYDGFPKVLLESLSSGCRAIITDLPGVKETLEKTCGTTDIVKYLPLPEMKSIDQPKEEGLPEFVENLKDMMKEQIKKCQTSNKNLDYAKKVKNEFSYEGLFDKYLEKYRELLS